MSATRSVSIKSIYLTDIGSNWIKPGRTRDHFGSHPFFSLMHTIRNSSEKTWIVIGGGTEYVPLLIQTDSPSVIIELMKKFHLGTIGFEAKSAPTKIVFFSI